MFQHLAGFHPAVAHAIGRVLAEPSPPPAPAEATVNTSGILAFFASRIIPILLAVLATYFISRASKGEVGKTMTSTGIVLLGLAMFAGAGLLLGFGTSIVHTIFG